MSYSVEYDDKQWNLRGLSEDTFDPVSTEHLSTLDQWEAHSAVLQQRLREAKQWINRAVNEAIEATVDADGCAEGKRDFLWKVGIGTPNVTVKFEVDYLDYHSAEDTDIEFQGTWISTSAS